MCSFFPLLSSFFSSSTDFENISSLKIDVRKRNALYAIIFFPRRTFWRIFAKFCWGKMWQKSFNNSCVISFFSSSYITDDMTENFRTCWRFGKYLYFCSKSAFEREERNTIIFSLWGISAKSGEIFFRIFPDTHLQNIYIFFYSRKSTFERRIE